MARYQFFVGELWARYGADAWLGPWQRVSTHPPGATRTIVAELRALANRDAALSASVLLEGVDAPERAQAALAAAFDDPAVTELAVYTLGDGGAMAGRWRGCSWPGSVRITARSSWSFCWIDRGLEVWHYAPILVPFRVLYHVLTGGA